MRTVFGLSLLFGAFFLSPTSGRGQLVADGSTNILDGISTNIDADIRVGTNGSFTLLALTNGAVVTGNSGAMIGVNPGAKSNVIVLNGPGSAWTNALDFDVGGSGSLNQLLIFSGAVVSDRSGIFGPSASSSNNLAVVSDPGSLWVNLTSLLVGQSGRAHQLIVSNGATLASGTMLLGPNGNSPSNIVTITGANSFWKTAGITIGQNGSAAFNQVLLANSGTISNFGDCTVGNSTFSNTFLVTDPGTRFTNSGQLQLGIGFFGRGNQLIVSNGGFTASDYTYVGTNAGFQNILTLTGAGSRLTNRHDFYLGRLAPSNQLYVIDGGTLADNFGYLGLSNIANRALISGTNALWTNRSDLYVGYGATAVHNQLTISNGARVFDNNGTIGANSGGTSNVVVVTGTTSLWTNRSTLTISQGGMLFVTNGGTVASPSTSVFFNGNGVTNRILVTGTGSVLRTLGTLSMGNGSTFIGAGNELVVSNGGMVLASNLSMNGQPSTIVVGPGGNLFVTNQLTDGYFCTLILDGGLINAAGLSQGGGGNLVVNFKRGTLQLGATGDFAVFPPTPFVVGDSNAQATFEMLSASGTHIFARGLAISSNAVMKGVGTVLGSVTVLPGGTLSPGSSIGQMNITNLVLSDGSTNVMELNPATGTSDTIIGLTNITYGGTLQLVNLAGMLTNGSTFQLYTARNYTGAFSAILPLLPAPGLKWNTNRLAVDGVLRVMDVHAPPPTIASVEISGGNIQLHATGGVPYDPCFALTCTNLSPPSDWQYISTNIFDSNGNALISLPVSAIEPARLYRLQVE